MAEEQVEAPVEAPVVSSPGVQLADDFYGTPEPEAVEKTAPESDDKVVESEDLVSEPEDTGDTDSVAEPSNNESDDGDNIQSLSQLAEHMETDSDFFKGLKTTEKVNGKDVEFSISEAIDTHMRVSAGDDYLSDAKAQAKSIIESATGEQENLAGTAAVFGALLKEAEALVGHEVDGLAELRVNDPAEYAAKKLELNERAQLLTSIRQRAGQAISKTTEDAKAFHIADLEKNLPAQVELLHARIPEWSKDTALAKKEQADVHKYMQTDFDSDEVQEASYNGKVLALAVKAMRYDNAKNKSDAARKKVVKIPKMLKPGVKKEEGKVSPSGNDRVGILYG